MKLDPLLVIFAFVLFVATVIWLMVGLGVCR